MGVVPDPHHFRTIAIGVEVPGKRENSTLHLVNHIQKLLPGPHQTRGRFCGFIASLWFWGVHWVVFVTVGFAVFGVIDVAAVFVDVVVSFCAFEGICEFVVCLRLSVFFFLFQLDFSYFVSFLYFCHTVFCLVFVSFSSGVCVCFLFLCFLCIVTSYCGFVSVYCFFVWDLSCVSVMCHLSLFLAVLFSLRCI